MPLHVPGAGGAPGAVVQWAGDALGKLACACPVSGTILRIKTRSPAYAPSTPPRKNPCLPWCVPPLILCMCSALSMAAPQRASPPLPSSRQRCSAASRCTSSREWRWSAAPCALWMLRTSATLSSWRSVDGLLGWVGYWQVLDAFQVGSSNTWIAMRAISGQSGCARMPAAPTALGGAGSGVSAGWCLVGGGYSIAQR